MSDNDLRQLLAHLPNRSVLLRRAARRCWRWLPMYAPVGAWLVGPCGEHLHVQADGTVEPLPRREAPQQRSSIAANPCIGPEAE